MFVIVAFCLQKWQSKQINDSYFLSMFTQMLFVKEQEIDQSVSDFYWEGNQNDICQSLLVSFFSHSDYFYGFQLLARFCFSTLIFVEARLEQKIHTVPCRLQISSIKKFAFVHLRDCVGDIFALIFWRQVSHEHWRNKSTSVVALLWRKCGYCFNIRAVTVATNSICQSTPQYTGCYYRNKFYYFTHSLSTYMLWP